MKEKTVEEMAEEYVATVNGPSDGLGRCVHPVYGVSHNMLRLMYKWYGEDESTLAISKVFARSGKSS